MEVELIGEVDSFEMDKRTYLPGVKLRWTCSECGEPAERDFGDNYLSYPDCNTPTTVHLWCSDCDYDGDSIQVQVNVSLSVIG